MPQARHRKHVFRICDEGEGNIQVDSKSTPSPRCIERTDVLIPGINRMQLATITSPDVYDYYIMYRNGEID